MLHCEFERRDLNINLNKANHPPRTDTFCGYYLPLPERELEFYLYLNKGFQEQYLLFAKPLPQILFFTKGKDYEDFIPYSLNIIKECPNVSQVIQTDLIKPHIIQEIIYLNTLYHA